jgi:hypothetical protein
MTAIEKLPKCTIAKPQLHPRTAAWFATSMRLPQMNAVVFMFPSYGRLVAHSEATILRENLRFGNFPREHSGTRQGHVFGMIPTPSLPSHASGPKGVATATRR